MHRAVVRSFPIDRAAGTQNHLFQKRPALRQRLRQDRRAHDVHVAILPRLLHRLPGSGARRKKINCLRLRHHPFHRLSIPGVGDLHLYIPAQSLKSGGPSKIGPMDLGIEHVRHVHLMPLRAKRLGRGGADKSAAADDEDFHEVRLGNHWRRRLIDCAIPCPKQPSTTR